MIKRLLLLTVLVPLLAAQSTVNTGNHRKIFTLSCSTCILDSVTATPKVAYALRKLRASYAGSAVRLLRASDSTTLDIGFNSNGTLNTSSVTTFCTSTTCTVSKWYDQSGNGLDATQATAASQPGITNSGIHSLPTITSTGGVKRLCIIDCSTNATMFPGYINSVVQISCTGFQNHYPVVIRQNNTSSGNEWSLRYNDAASCKYEAYNSTNGVITGSIVDGNSHIYSADAAATIYIDGTSQATGVAWGSTNTVGLASLLNGPAASTNVPFYGSVAEVFVWTAALSPTDRATLQHNQEAYFAISGV